MVDTWLLLLSSRKAHHFADANRLAQKFISDLRKMGHTIESATFDNGALEDINVPSNSTPRGSP